MAFLPPSPLLNTRASSLQRATGARRLQLRRPSARSRRSRVVVSTIGQQVSQDQLDPETKKTLQRYFETYTWRGHSINYRVDGPEDGMPVLIVHGFGASINHWRKNIPALTATSRLRVFTIDLLGFGASDKPSPKEVEYGIDLWKHLLVDFANDQNPVDKWCFVGNSIGSLTSLAAAEKLGQERVRACALVNSAGGLVSFRYSELNPFQTVLMVAFNTILFNRFTGPYLFENFRKRTTIASVLKQVYINQHAISEDLLDILCDPSMDDGACDVFLAILNADPGPTPEELLARLPWCPMLVVWGEDDPWTPLREGFHPGIKFPEYHPSLDLRIVPNAGHCVHDEHPEIVNEMLVPFLLSPSLKAKGNGV